MQESEYKTSIKKGNEEFPLNFYNKELSRHTLYILFSPQGTDIEARRRYREDIRVTHRVASNERRRRKSIKYALNLALFFMY